MQKILVYTVYWDTMYIYFHFQTKKFILKSCHLNPPLTLFNVQFDEYSLLFYITGLSSINVNKQLNL